MVYSSLWRTVAKSAADRNQTQNQGRSDSNQFHVRAEDIQADLSNERPIWELSSYGPGRGAPLQLIDGADQSPEEEHLLHWTAVNSGSFQKAAENQQRLEQKRGQLTGQIQTILGNLNGAVDYVLAGANQQPNRFSYLIDNESSRSASQSAQSGVGGITRNADTANYYDASATASIAPQQPLAPQMQSSAPHASSFDAPSAIGQKTSAFGQPSALGGGATFGQPSTPVGSGTFGQASALGQQQPAFGQAGFGQPKPSAPQGLGSKPNPFAQASTQAQPAFGQPTFGQPSQQTQSQNPFGQQQQPTQSPFGGQQQPQAQVQFAQPGFGQPSQQVPSTPGNIFSPGGTNHNRMSGPTPTDTTHTMSGAQGDSIFANGSSQQQPQNGASMQHQPNGFGAQPQPSQMNGITGKATPDPGSYMQLHPNGSLARWKGQPVHFYQQSQDPESGRTTEAHYTYPNQNNGGKEERIWFPQGPATEQDGSLKPNPDLVGLPEDYEGEKGGAVKHIYDYVRDNWQFEDGVMPELPPKKNWVRYDI